MSRLIGPDLVNLVLSLDPTLKAKCFGTTDAFCKQICLLSIDGFSGADLNAMIPSSIFREIRLYCIENDCQIEKFESVPMNGHVTFTIVEV